MQIDGSQHPWLDERGPTLALLIVAEDVTGTAAQTVLRPGKNSLGYLMLLEGWPAGGAVPALPPLLASTVGRKSPPRASSSGVGQAVGRIPTMGSLTDERRLLSDSVDVRSSFSVSLLGGR